MIAFKSRQIPDFDDLAILLDIDGTILDIAPAPEQVLVPASLCETLKRLSGLTDGALALVSGRPLADLDRLFGVQFPAVAGHGAEFRPRLGTSHDHRRVEMLDPALRRQIVAVAEAATGIRLEDKGYAIALHYRAAPETEAMVREAVTRICAGQPVLEALPGKYVLEVKDSRFNKATGVRDLMARPPFAGRRPIFIGDDTTDEFVFAIMPEFDGLAFSVGHAVGTADACFDGPAAVRAWLAMLAYGPTVAAPVVGSELSR